ncbi:MAG: hypothetical protein WC325_01630 [Candidatus Bathyarchaeia archaeon]
MEGTDKIQRDGNVYTLTGNLSAVGIIVQRSNIVLDGAGYTLDGKDDVNIGIDISNGRGSDYSRKQIVNVVIKNFRIIRFRCPLLLDFATNCSVVDNYLGNFAIGIHMMDGEFLIKHNSIENNIDGQTFLIPSYLSAVIGEKTVTENNFCNFSLWIMLPAEFSFDMNYYDGYKGTDTDENGIGDTTYVLYDRTEKQFMLQYVDEHPLIKPVETAPNIPEFPAWIILPLFFTTGLVVVGFRKKLRAVS